MLSRSPLASKTNPNPRPTLRTASVCATLALIAGCSSSESVSAQHSAISVNPDVVISQVYGGGGNSQAPYKNDFVELFNRSQSPVSIAGWSVQYASAGGAGTFAANGAVALSGTLQPGQHYLIQFAGGTTGGALPTADASGPAGLNLGSNAGKVVLVNNSTGLACNGNAVTCSAEQLASIVDLVGYGGTATNFFEGTGTSGAPALSNTTAAVRAGGGCTDTNQNSTDFTAGAPTPRNTSSDLAPCSTANVAPQVSVVSPANGAANVALDGNIAITFSENVTATGSWFSMSCTTSGNVSASVSGGPLAYTLDPSVTLANDETCTVTVTAASVTDADGLAMASNFVFSFKTLALDGLTAIHTIQGASHVSPLKGSVVTTRGIVTALDSTGYYLQAPMPDADDATSEAIFVFTGSAPTVHVGDDVQLTGTVAEFRSGCAACAPSSSAYPNLTNTEISTIVATSVISSNNALPAPLVIGVGGRIPPKAVIEDDANGDVEIVANTFDPANDGLDFYESLESMRVQVNDAVVVGPTATFSGGSLELPVLADNGAGAGLRTARGGILASASDFNPERITLANDLLPALPTANVGDTLPGAIVGVMGYTFANYKLLETQALPALVASGVSQEVTTLPARRPIDLDIAAFNVENLDPTDPPSKFAALAGILVNNLKSPDIVALEEIQDDNGATDNGVVTATATLNQLVAAVTTAGGPTYTFRSIDPVNDQDGGEPGGNIRVAFLYRTDRGLTFVDHPGATPTTGNSVVAGATGAELQYSPGRIDPTNSAFSNSRKPLAGQFSFQGQTFFVIANHFNSKGGDNPLFGRFQPPVLSSEVQRVNQATVVKTFVSQLLAADAKAQIVVLGDLNDFEFSPPVSVLKSAGLSTLVERLPASERYTYVYQGNSQVLDQVLVSSAANDHVVGYDVVHVNAEFATQASDHDPGVARISFETTGDGGSGGSGGGGAPGNGGGGAVGTGGVAGSGGTVGVGGVVGSGGTVGAGGVVSSGGAGGDTAGGTSNPGGGTSTGGAATGGAATGGAATGGAATAGAGAGGFAMGGSATAGAGTGGAPTAGAATGGTATGGAATAGAATGGTATGGAATAGAGTAGSSTAGAATGGFAAGGEAMGGDASGGDATMASSGMGGDASGGDAAGGKSGGISAGSNNGGADAGEASITPSKPVPGDDGCSCSTVPSNKSQSPLLLGFGLVLLGLARRRRSA